jgi:hypothetical protein
MQNDPTDLLVQAALACESVSTDPFGRPTFSGVTDTLNAPQFPATTPMTCLVFWFYSPRVRTLTQCSVRIDLEGLAEPLMQQPLPDVAFTSDRPWARVVVSVSGITWPSAGIATVQFRQREHVLSYFPLRIVQATVIGGPR